MKTIGRRYSLLCLFLLIAVPDRVRSAEFLLRNGMIIEGKPGYLASIAADMNEQNAGGAKTIVFTSNGITRTYVSTYQIVPEYTRESDPIMQQRIRISQPVAKGIKGVASIQSIVGVEPFDDLGRRRYSLLTNRGRMDIVQGITEITPVYTRLQALVGANSIEWDSRIATSSIPRETLSRILRNRPDADSANGRLDVVRLLFSAGRYRDAQNELMLAMEEFPELAELDELLETLRQKSAQLLVDEINLRKTAGQHRRVISLLRQFPDEGIAGETLEEVREILQEYGQEKTQGELILRAITDHIGELDDVGKQDEANQILDEIKHDLNINNIARFRDFVRLRDDPAMANDRKLALALSGWFLGEGSATDNLAVALSIQKVRDLVVAYLRSANAAEREEILQQIEQQEGGTPNYLAKIVGHIKPPLETEGATQLAARGFRIQIDTVPFGSVVYDVQLPDEYDPYRRYPTIVTLDGESSTPEQQIDWWCGAVDEDSNLRKGLATRKHGYIVIAPHWSRVDQRSYEFSFSEHQKVLASLRDALRRFAIDTDRVFLSGFSMGGDAAWDIALAHPDLWAGVIPIVATAYGGRKDSPRYISQYNEHAVYVPQYFVIGEMDGDNLALNQPEFDRYLSRAGFRSSETGYDTMIVEYRGRGHEHFYEEIHRLFEWMGNHERSRPDSYSCKTMRPWDTFFWSLEIDQLPEKTLADPLDWPNSARPSTSELRRIETTNRLAVTTAAGELTMWLSPECIDFDREAIISVNGKKNRVELAGSVRDLLEDVRTRGDRLHPYWQKLNLETGRRR